MKLAPVDMVLQFAAGPVHSLVTARAKKASMLAFPMKYIINLVGGSVLTTNGGYEALLKRLNCKNGKLSCCLEISCDRLIVGVLFSGDLKLKD